MGLWPPNAFFPLHCDLNKSQRVKGGYDRLSFDELQLCLWHVLIEKTLSSKPKQPSARVKLQHCWRLTDLGEKIITGGQIIKIQCRQYLEGKYNQLWDGNEIWGVFWKQRRLVYMCLHSEDPWLHSWRADIFILATCFPLCRSASRTWYLTGSLDASYFTVFHSRLPLSSQKTEEPSCKKELLWGTSWRPAENQPWVVCLSGSGNANVAHPWSQRSNPMAGYGWYWYLCSAHACFLFHLVHSLCVSLPASCPMHHASFLLCPSCMLSALCSTIRLLQRDGWGRQIHANKIDELPGRARYSFSNWHNSGFADLAPGGERGRLVN